MPDAIEEVLRLVAEGRITAAEAGPILDALGESPSDEPEADLDQSTAPGDASPARPSSIRIEVTEGGRKTINLRIPVGLGRLALDRIPGMSESTVDLVRQALANGRTGTLLNVDDSDGDGVRIALE